MTNDEKEQMFESVMIAYHVGRASYVFYATRKITARVRAG